MGDQNIDGELVKQAKKGNKKAFDALMLKYQNKIIKVIGRIIEDPNEALDVAQETFIKAYRALPNFREASTFYTWLYRIAVNTAKNHAVYLRRQPSGVTIDIDTVEHSSGFNKLKENATPEGFLVRDEVEVAVFKALDSLPEDLKNAIILRELAGLSYADIAKVMDCPLGTVRSRIFRARELIDLALISILKK